MSSNLCPPLADNFYLLDCHAALAMNPSEAQDAARTLVRRRHMQKTTSLRASASDAWQSSLFYVARSAQNLLFTLSLKKNARTGVFLFIWNDFDFNTSVLLTSRRVCI